MLLVTFALIAVLGLGPLLALIAFRRRLNRKAYLKGIIGACVSQLLAVYAVIGLAIYRQPDQPLTPGILFAALMTYFGVKTIRATQRDLVAAR